MLGREIVAVMGAPIWDPRNGTDLALAASTRVLIRKAGPVNFVITTCLHS